MRTGIAIALGVVIGAVGIVVVGLSALYLLSPPPEKWAESRVREREAEIGMPCQSVSARARSFIDQHVPPTLETAKASGELGQERYAKLRVDTVRLTDTVQKCLGIEVQAREAKLPFPVELNQHWKVLKALSHLLETHQKESQEASRFGQVWKSAALTGLEMQYGDLTAGSRSGARQEQP